MKRDRSYAMTDGRRLGSSSRILDPAGESKQARDAGDRHRRQVQLTPSAAPARYRYGSHAAAKVPLRP
jgi:hypothetical protein